MRPQARPFVYVLPAEQNEVLLKDPVDLRLRKSFADRAAVFVKYNTTRLVEHLPSALPRQIADIGVFQIKGTQQLIEAAKFQEFPAIESTRTSAAVEAWISVGD